MTFKIVGQLKRVPRTALGYEAQLERAYQQGFHDGVREGKKLIGYEEFRTRELQQNIERVKSGLKGIREIVEFLHHRANIEP